MRLRLLGLWLSHTFTLPTVLALSGRSRAGRCRDIGRDIAEDAAAIEEVDERENDAEEEREMGDRAVLVAAAVVVIVRVAGDDVGRVPINASALLGLKKVAKHAEERARECGSEEEELVMVVAVEATWGWGLSDTEDVAKESNSPTEATAVPANCCDGDDDDDAGAGAARGCLADTARTGWLSLRLSTIAEVT